MSEELVDFAQDEEVEGLVVTEESPKEVHKKKGVRTSEIVLGLLFAGLMVGVFLFFNVEPYRKGGVIVTGLVFDIVGLVAFVCLRLNGD